MLPVMPSHQPKIRRFHDLAPYRVREILLVSSPYDAFILEEDGQLSEQVYREYRDLSLSGPPRVTHMPTGSAAVGALADRRFDLILAMSSLSDMTVNDFGRRVKVARPGKPVVFLALDARELEEVEKDLDPECVDGRFLWTGDPQILLAIIKFVEDRFNVEHDVAEGNVRAILVIEDSPRYYSKFLGMLYEELMKQSRSLYSEGVNELQRRMYMRSRPKILLATSFEEGSAWFERFTKNMMAIICDLRMPHGGVIDPRAGLELARQAREAFPELPLLLQSAEIEHKEEAVQAGARFVDKNSPRLLAEVRSFLKESLGFGDFIFRMPDYKEVDRAVDVRDLERKLETVPDEAIAFHAAHDHFSIWLMARSEFAMAERIRPKKLSDFESIGHLRRYLISELRDARDTTQHGEINDFRRETFSEDHFSRIGRGSLGGKARGIAFLNLRLALTDESRFGGLPVHVPKTVVITTDYFDAFVDGGGLRQFASETDDDAEIARRFVSRPLPIGLLSDLRFIVERLEGPLAIRSSSVLEDSMHQPFAGIYSTLMIPNMAADPNRRLRELSTAIRLVYASTFFRNAKSYLEATGTRLEEEKMAVIVQKVVGRLHDRRFYPTVSGVAQSHNFYPIGPQRPEDGVVHLALGLGRVVVDGGQALRFSPKHPGVLPQLSTRQQVMKSTQRHFFAIDIDKDCCEAGADLYSTLSRYELRDAEEDGTLPVVGSVFSPDEERLKEDFSIRGPRVVTFHNFLKHRAIPLVESLNALLEVAWEGLGCPIEIEFACDLGDWGRPTPVDRERRDPRLYALQIRPFAARTAMTEPSLLRFAREETLCASTRSLGHGIEESITDIVHVRPDTWKAASNKKVAQEVGELNEQLGREGRPYLLIGPGRWGTADPWLGVPVQWSQISHAKVIVEASPAGYEVEPSQGTHFFQNITSLHIGYLTLPPGAEMADDDDFLDWQWLGAQAPAWESGLLRHLRLSQPVTVVLDGRSARGLIAKPGAERL